LKQNDSEESQGH